MFNGFTKETIDFMWSIRLNNEKPWFEAHKEEYIRVFLTPMKDLGQEVFQRISGSGERKFIHKVSRIYKDARRLGAGEGPYRDNLWFSIERPSEEWTSTPVFWFELKPENWSYGLGYYRAKPATMEKLRNRIDNNPKEFEELIAPLDTQNEFLLHGSEYVRKKPAPTPKTEPWYNKKTFSVMHTQNNGIELFSHDLADRLVEGFNSLMPLYDYLIVLDEEIIRKS